jgi:sirohydrochlorin cobaltochelatase
MFLCGPASNNGLTMVDNCSGVLVIGHGTQDASGTRAYFEIFDGVRQMLPGTLVEGAFLEFAQPTIAEGIAQLKAQGVARIAVVPLFLSAAGHMRKDVPQAVAEAAGQCSEVEISLKPQIGTHRGVLELSALRFRQALEGCEEIPMDETLLVMAAHGSPEPEAIEELAGFAARREKLNPVGRVESCFVVLGQPQLADLPARLKLASYRRIVVQSHLLLRGRYHDMICQQVEIFRREFPDIDWIVTEPLGPDPLLAQAVVEIVKDEP